MPCCRNGLHSTYFSHLCQRNVYLSLSKSRATHLHTQPPRYPLELYEGLEVVGTVGFCGLLHAAGAHSSGTMLINLAMPWSVLSSLTRYRLLNSAASRGIFNMLNVLEVIDCPFPGTGCRPRMHPCY